MKILILFFLPCISMAASIPPMPFPIFLKVGFSSVLEFEDTPTRVVLGDAQNFQIERLDHSLVVRTLAPYAVGNMFVYFKDKDPQLFILKASEDAEPTYYRKFEPPVIPKKLNTISTTKSFFISHRGARTVSSFFDRKKDYLTIEIEISANSDQVVKPNWSLIRLSFNNSTIVPNKLWSERQEVQKDSRVKARFIFFKPNVPRNLKDVYLVIPLQGEVSPLKVLLEGGRR
jgi:hypothetical protein